MTTESIIPDDISKRLNTRRIGEKIYSYAEVDSTNDIAIKLAESGAAEGTVVLAEHQRKGRGRFDRTWHSPTGKNILCSIILKPPIGPKRISQISLMTAVAVASLLRSEYDLPALIKWPNDIYLGGRKVSGILVEMGAELDLVHYAVVGIGINLNTVRSDFPPSIRSLSTSVKIETGKKVDRVLAARLLLTQIDRWYHTFLKQGFDLIGNTWVDMSLTLGKRITAKTSDGRITGIPTGLDEDGSLLLRLDSGIIKKIASGDILIQTA